MIVVINPSGGAGKSFKGLDTYAAHDPDQANTAERVEWVDSHNIANDDPGNAWRIMWATAQAQNDLKKAAGHRAGRPAKDGPVLHIIMNYAEGEPQDRESMKSAAVDLLSELGDDFRKKRGKAKRDRVQFADEHQAKFYCHTDSKTGQKHLHIMLNRVHPLHGLNLPDGNDQLKAQKWALKFSERHGTDKRTPARAENEIARANGEYVLSPRRKSRNAYDRDKVYRVSNDNHLMQKVLQERAKKDAALMLRTRNMKKMHVVARNALINAHQQRKAALARSLKKQISKHKAAVFEEFRPLWRALPKRQAAERKTFEGLEKGLFGRLANSADTVKKTIGEKGIIGRGFRIFTNAGDRKAHFEAAQKREIKTLEQQQAKKLADGTKSLKAAHKEKLAQNRAVFFEERHTLQRSQLSDKQDLKKDWQTQTHERKAEIEALSTQVGFTNAVADNVHETAKQMYADSVADRFFAPAADQHPALEQNNSKKGRDEPDR